MNFIKDTSTEIIFKSNSLLYGGNSSNNNKLFLKMASYEWRRDPIRASPDSISAAVDANGNYQNLISRIYVPVPKEIEHGSNVLYVDDINIVEQAKSFRDLLYKGAELGPGNILGYSGIDRTDTLFVRNEKRKYNLKFTLVATNSTEAQQIMLITTKLESLTLLSLRGGLVNFPPLWLFGIGLGLGNNIEPAWLGQPQFCVLQSVTVSPTAGGFPYLMDDSSNKNPLPLITSVSMNFIEFQSSYRKSSGSSEIVNRSVIDRGGE
jgi:hypothetical protein